MPARGQRSSRAMRGLRGGNGGTVAVTGRAPAKPDSYFAPAAIRRGRRRFGILCRSSHTRTVSTETPTPSLPSDSAISRIDAPARRSASRTSQYGSSSANRRDRGRRPSAIRRASAWGSFSRAPLAALGPGCASPVAVGRRAVSMASLLGRSPVEPAAKAGRRPVAVGALLSCSPVDAAWSFVCMVAIYLPPAGGAMGGARAASKRNRLDVGVCTYVLISGFRNRCGEVEYPDSIHRFVFGVVDSVDARFNGFRRLLKRFGCFDARCGHASFCSMLSESVSGQSGQGFIAGGGSC
jgi:hypothetical protein